MDLKNKVRKKIVKKIIEKFIAKLRKQIVLAEKRKLNAEHILKKVNRTRMENFDV